MADSSLQTVKTFLYMAHAQIWTLLYMCVVYSLHVTKAQIKEKGSSAAVLMMQDAPVVVGDSAKIVKKQLW
jgi:hypothetical protein